MSAQQSTVSPMHLGTGLVTWARLRDRFASYRESTPVLEALRQAAEIPGVEGVDISRGYLPDDLRQVKATLKELSLPVSAVGTALSKEPRTVRGAFSSENPDVRRASINIVKECMDIAVELGTDKILLWLGQDGYDYHFEMDYDTHWGRIVDGLRECARHRRDVRICIEYKAREPKIHQLVNSAATTLVLIEDVGEENIGVLYDIGHALLANEMLAETATLLARRGKLWHIHLNDNYFHADSDLVPGMVHTMAIIELLYWLRRIEYRGFLCYDTVALTHDPKQIITECIKYTQALVRVADRIDPAKFEQILAAGDTPAGLSLVREALFGVL